MAVDRPRVAPAKTPQRTCVGCRRVAPCSELTRVVAVAGGGLAVGRDLPGRGAWLCAGSPDCLEAACRRKALGRALRAELAAGAVAGLRARLAGHGSIEGSQTEPGSPRWDIPAVAGEKT